MAGLLSPGGQGTTTSGDVARDTGPVRGEETEAPEGEAPEGNVSPEEQQEYELFVDNAIKLMSEPRVAGALRQNLQAEDPVDGLASAAVMVVKRLKDSAKKAGREVNPDVLMHGGAEILEILASTAAKAGIHDFSEEETENALYRAMDLYRETSKDEIDQEAHKQDFGQLIEAERSGRLGEMIPGIEEYAARAPMGPEEDPAGTGEMAAKGRR